MKRIKYWAAVADAPLSLFQQGILEWYRAFGRDLPWRHTRDPYKILVSEILLHQTMVKTVEPVYRRFLDRFPDVFALARAPLAEVKEITDPLGYKVRGQWLWRIARMVVEEMDGQFPDTLEGLLALPGVGRYTAGAVLSFAFGHDAPILDTNVTRLVGRYFGVNDEKPGADTRHRLWALAEAVIPAGLGPEFNQALMDMGALVCTARKPLCLYCPVRAGCAAFGGEEGPGTAAEERVAYRLRGHPVSGD